MRYYNPRRRNVTPYEKDLFRFPEATKGFGDMGQKAFMSDVEQLGQPRSLSTGFGPKLVLEKSRRDKSRSGADAR